ncbi:hypothetical protein ACFWDA_26190 [Rhodococcus zopfii]|nr:hypothetical protein [Rhodococcus zopfii]
MRHALATWPEDPAAQQVLSTAIDDADADVRAYAWRALLDPVRV